MSKTINAIQAVADLGCELENTKQNLDAVKVALTSANRSKDDLRVRLDMAHQQITNMAKRLRELEEKLAAPLHSMTYSLEVEESWPSARVLFHVIPKTHRYTMLSPAFMHCDDDTLRDIARQFGEKAAEDIGEQDRKSVV